MPRSCTICSHRQRADIEADLVRGETLRLIAERTATTPWSLLRHRRHMGQSLGAGREEREAALGGDLLQRLGELEADARRALARAERIASEAEQEPRVALEATRTALLALREHARQIELLGKLRGELRSEVTVNVEANIGVQVIEAMPLEEREVRARNALAALERQRQRLATGTGP